MTSHPEYGVETSGIEVAKAFSEHIKDQYVLVTGVSKGGIGESLALAIASQSPALLLLASRTQFKLDEVAQEVKSLHPSVKIETVLVDLMSQDSVRRAAAQINAKVPRVDILINNAGVVFQRRCTSPEGIEGQFATNHIGPFLLTNLIMEKIVAAAKTNGKPPGSTRVINVSSTGHRLSPIRFSDPNFEGKVVPPEELGPQASGLPPSFTEVVDGYPCFRAYGQSKTANVLFAMALTKRLKDGGILSYASHPGSIWTGLSRNLDEENSASIKATSHYWKTLDEGASTILVAAFDPALNNPSGIYLSDCQFAEAAEHATDPVTAEKLWQLSEQFVKEKFDVTSML